MAASIASQRERSEALQPASEDADVRILLAWEARVAVPVTVVEGAARVWSVPLPMTLRRSAKGWQWAESEKL